MGLQTFFLCSFFFFLPPHWRWPFVVKKTTDWAEILHNHTYGHASGRRKKYFRCAHIVMKSLIGLIFCRNMFMDSLRGQLKNDLVEVIFQ